MKILILLILATMATSRSNQKPSSANQEAEGRDSISQNLKKLKDLVMEKMRINKTGLKSEVKRSKESEDRKQKSMNYYSYLPRPLMHFEYTPNLQYYYPQSKDFSHLFPDEWLSRTEPFKRKTTQHLLDSPTYYIRLPPNPYVFVPGVGYISRPPTLTEPEVLNTIEETKLEKPTEQEVLPSSFIHMPIDFVSNGKPTSVYQLPNDPTKPKPESAILTLNKGPYVFNGKPTDIYVLRNSYNSIYADALTHFYP